MSKSKGNVVAPQKVSETLGAEVLRLWVGATDYSGDLSISDEILKRVVESYRRLRNTLRFLMANTVDFDPARDAVPVAELVEVDRYALARLAGLAKEVAGDYDRYEYHLVVKRLTTYASEDLGGFYLDVLKDRLYTAAASSRARRSAQTALAIIRDALLKLLARSCRSPPRRPGASCVRRTRRSSSTRGRISCPPCRTRTRCCRSGSGSSPCAPPCCASSSSCGCRAASARRCRRT